MAAQGRHAVLWLWLIVLLALLLRIGFAWQYTQKYSHRALGVQPFLFESGNIAYSLASGGGFASPFRVETGPTAWLAPIYPALLAVIMRIAGANTFASFVAAVGVNILCVTLVCVPLFFAASEIAGEKTAYVATLLWAVFPNAILIPVEAMWEASLSALQVAWIVWATLWLRKNPSLGRWLLYGLLWGATLLTNPAVGVVLPVLVVWVVWRESDRTQRTRQRRGGLAFVATVMVCCTPWTVRNYFVFHDLVPLKSDLGLQLWLGNNPAAQPIWRGQGHPVNDSLERERYISVGETAYMGDKRRAALDFMTSNPGREAVLIGRRFVSLWCGGTPYPLRDFMNVDSLQFRFVLIFNVLVALGAIAGMIRLMHARSPHLWLLAAFPILFPLIYYVTLVAPRYRFPIDPVLMMLTAVAVTGIRSNVWGREG